MPGRGRLLHDLHQGRHHARFDGAVLQILDQGVDVRRAGVGQQEVRYGVAGRRAELRMCAGAEQCDQFVVLGLREKAHRSQPGRRVPHALHQVPGLLECAQQDRHAAWVQQGGVHDACAGARSVAQAEGVADTFRAAAQLLPGQVVEGVDQVVTAGAGPGVVGRRGHRGDHAGGGEEPDHLGGPDGVRARVVGLGRHDQAGHTAVFAVPQRGSAVTGEDPQWGAARVEDVPGAHLGLDMDVDEGAGAPWWYQVHRRLPRVSPTGTGTMPSGIDLVFSRARSPSHH